ncbi:hypothetical protein [Vibrio sp. T11.5]|uniref:hypothetical protein n=1 Tax=Vibrio sp. T11.5 TaxID=2998836 RepID=UPI0022CD9C0C|nr:hypothetical protein [Vibrio sp. T11.5]MDA0120953.1 hypothetical protein [Vibrio sp. T11.5]
MELIEHRSKLIPMWIKVIGWIFVSMGALSLLALLSKLLGVNVELSLDLFGLTNDNSKFNAQLALISGLYMFFAISAFGLLRGKNWGLNACLGNGYLGIAICLYVMISSFSTDSITIRLEPIIQVIYLWKLYKIKPHWNPPQET